MAWEVLNWAEQETTEIHSFAECYVDDKETDRISGELFNVLVTALKGEPLQMLHNCDYNGAKAWRRLSRWYSPSTPLRAMQLMLQGAKPGRPTNLKDVPNILDNWESRVLMLEKDLKEVMSSRMKAAILMSIFP